MSTARRPKTIQELAQLATTQTYDPSRDLKDQLRAAEHLRKQGKESERAGDLENAFVGFARAATIILDKIPKHSQYHKLGHAQKDALAGNGQDLLEKLERLKPRINDAHEHWIASGGEAAAARAEAEAAEREEEERHREQEERQRQDRRRQAEDERARLNDEEMYRRRDAEERERAYRRKQEEKEREMRALDAARIAREQARAQKQQEMDDYYRSARRRDNERQSARDWKQQGIFADVNAAAGIDYPSDRYSREPDDPIPNRGPTPSGASPTSPNPITYPAVHPSQIAYVTPPKRDELGFSSPGPLPLESPNYQYHNPMDSNDYTYLNEAPQRPSYPGLMTTSSPPLHNQRPIEYPQLMSPHQMQQGYRPSASGMFMDPALMFAESPPGPPIPSFPTGPLSYPQVPNAVTTPYSYQPQGPLASAPTILQRTPSIPAMAYTPPRQNSGSRSAASTSGYPISMPSAAPPRPAKVPISPPRVSSQSSGRKSATPPRFSLEGERRDSPEPIPAEVASPPKSGLCTVYLPGETLHKFMRIAAVNTERKVETCGLLLGRKTRNTYTVQSLLIPRQTSDENSCTMTNEELVFEFQENRGLLTLGWIHTHPTQSCFMSSLDLHTHSAFQAMLPEAFAIVCAPKSNPSFGIFRLTDPPGLQIIMNCNDQRTFHPHPDKPIYTDADSGHVRMVPDLPLEIADLRNEF
ncbi:hypothetical protein FS837_009762 [Tulasnella sp. UAMH 9824]|nr:hypothetical protein FS837_009762 [Tulasnella sp. UAMH 9824]